MRATSSSKYWEPEASKISVGFSVFVIYAFAYKSYFYFDRCVLCQNKKKNSFMRFSVLKIYRDTFENKNICLQRKDVFTRIKLR